MKKIYFFKNYIKHSEYDVTMNRIASYFNYSEFTNDTSILNDPSNIVFLIDAYKAGLLLSGRKCNYVIILGLKDMNSYIHDDMKFSVVKTCLYKSSKIVVFDEFMKVDIGLNIPRIKDSKIKVISQAVSRLLIKPFNLRSYLKIYDNRPLYAMVGYQSDPLYLKDVFDKLYDLDKTTLIFINVISDNKFNFPSNSKVLNNMDRLRIHSILQQVDGLINCSINETMNNTILEAMKIGCPVYARRNLGCINIICNYINGFIFEYPEEFIQLRKLDSSLVINEARKLIQDNYDSIDEKKLYYDLVIELTQIKRAMI